MEQTKDMFDPVRDAGLSQGEFAELAGVSRLTVNKWMQGHFKPHRLHAANIESLVDEVKERLDDGKLPLSPRLRGTARKEALRALLRDV